MQIEKNIPIPESFKGNKERYSKYPFYEMDVGDSVFYEGQDNLGPAYSSATKAGLRSVDNRKFTSRRENGGLRIWRTE